MSEAFDPYRQWLGREGRPRDLYELLGVSRHESDKDAIARQADALLARIRGIRPGPHLSAWQELLDALTAAKRCLTDPQARANYDTALAERNHPADAPPPALGGVNPALPEQSDLIGATNMPQPSETGTAPALPAPAQWPDEVLAQAAEYRPGITGATPPAWWLLRILAVVVLLLAAVLGGLVWRQHRQGRWAEWASLLGTPSPTDIRSEDGGPLQPGRARLSGQANTPASGRQSRLRSTTSAPLPPAPADPPGVLARAPAAPTDSGQTGPALGGSEAKLAGAADAHQPAPGKPKDAPADAQKLQALRAGLSQARAAMARRDLASARKHLKAAEQQVQGPEDEAHVARVENLLSNLEEFWKGMQQVLATVQPAQEFTVGTTPIIVVSADARSLTYRSEGANRTVTLQDMPGPLVLALAEAGFATAPSQKVLIAAFLAADAQGDPRRARRLLEEAAQAGEDVGALLAVLEAQGPGALSDKLPPPDASRLQEARQEARKRFEAEFRSATRAPAKAALAQKLIAAAGDAALPAELRYALLAEACDLAVAAGKAGAACEVVDQIEQTFRVDALALKVAVLERLARAALGMQSQKEFVETAMKTASQAIEAQRSEEARKLADSALTVARRSRSPVLLRAAQTGRQQLGLDAAPGER